MSMAFQKAFTSTASQMLFCHFSIYLLLVQASEPYNNKDHRQVSITLLLVLRYLSNCNDLLQSSFFENLPFLQLLVFYFIRRIYYPLLYYFHGNGTFLHAQFSSHCVQVKTLIGTKYIYIYRSNLVHMSRLLYKKQLTYIH